MSSNGHYDTAVVTRSKCIVAESKTRRQKTPDVDMTILRLTARRHVWYRTVRLGNSPLQILAWIWSQRRSTPPPIFNHSLSFLLIARNRFYLLIVRIFHGRFTNKCGTQRFCWRFVFILKRKNLHKFQWTQTINRCPWLRNILLRYPS